MPGVGITFSSVTTASMERAINRLKEEAAGRLKGVVLDLRNNPAFAHQSVKISDAFLNQGEIVSTRSRRADEGQRFNAKPGDITEGSDRNPGQWRLRVRIGDRRGRCRIIAAQPGTRTFGKGSVQTIIPSGRCDPTDHRAVLHPSGRSIQARGIDPDIVSSKPSWRRSHSPNVGAKKLRPSG